MNIYNPNPKTGCLSEKPGHLRAPRSQVAGPVGKCPKCRKGRLLYKEGFGALPVSMKFTRICVPARWGGVSKEGGFRDTRHDA